MGKKTIDLDKMHYSPALIRELEDPEYAKAAAEYERQARAERAAKARGEAAPEVQPYGSNRASQDQYSYDEYLAARQQGEAQGSRASSAKKTEKKQQAPKKSRKKADKNPAYFPVERKPKKKKKIFRKVLLLIAVLYLALMAYVLSVASHMDKVDTTGEDFAINEQVAKDMKMYRNIVILGSDARKDEGYDSSRTDAIIILSIHRLTGETKMISVMRDSYLKFRDREGDLILDKITHAHAFGGGVNTVEGLNRSLDLNIREYLIFNWQAVADTVDTLGGIEVDVKKKEISDMNTWGPETGRNVGKKYHKIKSSGVQTLDGVQATTYCRIRKTSGGDTGRAERYKKVLAGVMKKAIKEPGKMGALSNDVMPEIRTNMNSWQVATLTNRLPFLKMEKGVSWPKQYYGGIVNGVWYAVPRTLNSNVKRLHKKAFEQEGYRPSSTCRDINDEIIATTGVQ